MDTAVREDLLGLFRLLRQERDAHNGDSKQAFAECFKVFRRQPTLHSQAASLSSELSTISRLKKLIPEATIAEAMAKPAQSKRMDELVRDIQSAHTLSKSAELFEFIRSMVGTFYEMGDGVLGNVDRASETPTPESGFATTPSDGYLPHFDGAGNRSVENYNNGNAASLNQPLSAPLRIPVRKPPSSLPLSSQKHHKASAIPVFPVPGHLSLTESQIIRDLLCVAEGFNGSKVVDLGSSDGPRLARDVQVPEEWRQVILCIAMTGWLHLQLKRYVESHKSEVYPHSLCAVALGSVAQEEMRSCRQVITLLDTKFRRDSNETSQDFGGRLTLMKVYRALQNTQHRFAVLLEVVENAQHLKGGPFLSKLHECSFNGDPVVQQVVSKLLSVAVVPMLDLIVKWVFDGTIDGDRYDEFFITRDLQALETSAWAEQYRFREDCVPYFLTTEVAKKLFTGGKSYALIHDFFGHKEVPGMKKFKPDKDQTMWDENRNRIKPAYLDKLAEACLLSAKTVVDILVREHNLGNHFSALQKFFLLGQGDFALSLIDGLGEHLDRPAVDMYLRNLTAALNTSIRSTNVQFEHPDVIRALDTLIKTVGDQEIGWDAFLLEYRVKRQLQIVFTDTILNRYKRIFASLWRLKRTEYILCKVWKEDMFNRGLNRFIPGFQVLLHDARLLLNRMQLFVQQVQFSFSVEVLEVAWNDFQGNLAKARSLDDILVFHNDYLTVVEEKCFIQSKTHKNILELGIHLRMVLDQIVKFDSCYADIQCAADEEMSRLMENQPDFNNEFYLTTVPTLSTRISNLRSVFKSEVCRFNSMLEEAENSEPTSTQSVRRGIDYNRH
ncbi:hypothetical protein RvY_15231 [Ramazzottius varieornatus]|uniref:Uncharacterized protein n=1 Tax=Ramazzottius varieornatus TaxID=947166 RepID=A0A1D1VXM3_RAMVA|nr:hypothetical protein RvY_15231 [Ramazzottius varieornatus]